MATITERLTAFIQPEPNSGCWLWAGAVNSGGYGKIGHDGKTREAHSVSYELHRGPIPPGLELDHKCRVRCCVNPDHLEPVTHAENLNRAPDSMRDAWRAMNAAKRAQTRCKHGHEFTPENTAVYRGKRVCKACRAEWSSKRWFAKKEALVK